MARRASRLTEFVNKRWCLSTEKRIDTVFLTTASKPVCVVVAITWSMQLSSSICGQELELTHTLM